MCGASMHVSVCTNRQNDRTAGRINRAKCLPFNKRNLFCRRLHCVNLYGEKFFKSLGKLTPPRDQQTLLLEQFAIACARSRVGLQNAAYMFFLVLIELAVDKCLYINVADGGFAHCGFLIDWSVGVFCGPKGRRVVIVLGHVLVSFQASWSSMTPPCHRDQRIRIVSSSLKSIMNRQTLPSQAGTICIFAALVGARLH